MKDTFDYASDVLPEGRKKYIHTVGVTGKVEFIASENPYSGLFKGCKNVILRLSSAKEPDTSKTKPEEALNNFTPGFGIKFLRDNIPSVSHVAMYGVNGQKSWNFFAFDFSNHIAAPTGKDIGTKTLVGRFETASKFTTMIGLKNLAAYEETGVEVQSVKFPYRLVYRPNPEFTKMFTDGYSQYFTDQLVTLPKDKWIYEVFAQETPEAQPTAIGKLWIREKFVKSYFGDRYLFFKHEYMDDDFHTHPDWEGKKFEQNILQDPNFKKAFLEIYGFEHP